MMKLYIDYCEKKSEIPNSKLLKKLYNLEVRTLQIRIHSSVQFLDVYVHFEPEDPIIIFEHQVSEDEIIVSDCGLQDVSISPFIDALCEHRTVAMLDVSHNALGK